MFFQACPLEHSHTRVSCYKPFYLQLDPVGLIQQPLRGFTGFWWGVPLCGRAALGGQDQGAALSANGDSWRGDGEGWRGGFPTSAPALNCLGSPIPRGCLWFEQSEKPGSRKSSVSPAIRSFGLSPDSCEIRQRRPQGHSSVYVCTRRGRQLTEPAQPRPSPGASRALWSGFGRPPVPGKAPACTPSWGGIPLQANGSISHVQEVPGAAGSVLAMV